MHIAFVLLMIGMYQLIQISPSFIVILVILAALQPLTVAAILKLLFFDGDLEAHFLSSTFCMIEDVAEKAYRATIASFCLPNIIFR